MVTFVELEIVEPPDAWGGRQPKYENLVMRGPSSFFLRAALPSGEPGLVPLGPLPAEMPLPHE